MSLFDAFRFDGTRAPFAGGGWFGPDAPCGGCEQSGIGRAMGIEGFAGYPETKTIGLPASA
jgi:aldehyde dehydrogenase (NAD+)